MQPQKNIQAYILSGGKSTRMGSDKGFAVLSGKTFIERIIYTLTTVTDNISIIANNDSYLKLNYPVIKDIIPEKGPIGGIYTGLINSKHEINLFVSCDIPLISSELLFFLISKYNNQQALIIKHNDQIEPLCGIYHKSATQSFKKLIDEGNLSMHNALKHLHTEYLDVSNETFYNKTLLNNINSPVELKKTEEELSCAK